MKLRARTKSRLGQEKTETPILGQDKLIVHTTLCDNKLTNIFLSLLDNGASRLDFLLVKYCPLATKEEIEYSILSLQFHPPIIVTIVIVAHSGGFKDYVSTINIISYLNIFMTTAKK